MNASKTITTTTDRPGTHRHRLVVAALGCVLAGSALGAAAVSAGTQLFGGTPAIAEESGSSSADSTNGANGADGASGTGGAATLALVKGPGTAQTLSAADIYEQNVNSVVGVKATELLNYHGFGVEATSTGSGFVIAEDGYILTAASVVAGHDTIEVSFADGTVYQAELVGSDADTNVAVLIIDADGLQAVTVDDSGSTRVGENVYAIGSPLGEFPSTFAAGIVSGLDRDAALAGISTADLLQTSIATGPADLGGALFNENGEVIGMTCTSLACNTGLAIPIDAAVDAARQLVETGSVAKPFIGVRLSDTPERLRSFGVPQGAVVLDVIAGSPAEKAGLQADDVVTSFDGKTIGDAEELLDAIEDATVGNTVTLEVYRAGETAEVEVTVGDQAAQADGGDADEADGGEESNT